MRRLSLIVAFGWLVTAGGFAEAGETGSISGVVKDPQAGALPGATVKVSGALLPAGREATTSQGGAYWIPRLLPGSYKVEARVPGMSPAIREVVVLVDKDAQVDFVLAPTLAESVTVVAATPVADLRSTEVSFNYSSELIGQLPLERSYRGLFQLVPGVADNRVDGVDSNLGPAAGGSRQDNTFLMDGVNITNPGFGYLATEVNELDIVEFNVKRGAITAEFGRSAGLVTNAVTRSGTNQVSGIVRFEAIPKGLVADSKDPDIANTTDRWVPAFGVGGPFVKDKLWWYGSGRFFRSRTSDRRNSFGALPDRKEDVNELFGKLTFQPSARHFLNASFRHRPQTVDFAGIGAKDSPSVATDTDNTNRIARAEWSFFPTGRNVVDVKYLHLEEQNQDVAVTDLGFRPEPLDARDLARMGLFFDAARDVSVGGASLKLNRQNYTRDEVKATFTRSFDLGGTSHLVEAGGSWEETEEDLTRTSNGWGSLSIVQGGTQIQATYFPDQPSQLSKSRTWGLFVQDAVTLGRRLTLDAGALLNRDEFAQEIQTRNTFLSFGFLDEVQPRIGVNYNLRAGKGDKLYANYGRYYNLDQKSSARALAPLRLFQSDALFTRSGDPISDTPRASTTGKVIDPDVRPPYVDEILAGYAAPIKGPWRAEAFFMHRRAKDFIEDFPRTPPASNYIYANLPSAVRKYTAFTLEVDRRFAGRWSGSASYTWSRLEGNFDLDNNGAGDSTRTSAIFNTSSAIQDGPGNFVEDEGRFGPLAQDRPHVLKLFATVTPVDRLTLGGYYRLQSGTPWAAKGRDYFNGFGRFLEPNGSRRNDTWHNVDLLAAYRFRLGDRLGLGLEGRLLNAFNTQRALFRDQRQFLDGRIRTSAPPYLVQGTTQPNPQFGQPTELAPARRLLLTVLLTF